MMGLRFVLLARLATPSRECRMIGFFLVADFFGFLGEFGFFTTASS